MGLCYSALLNLYDLYSCVEGEDNHRVGAPDQVEMQKIAIAGTKEVSRAVFRFSRSVRAVAELGGLLKTSPLIANCLYQAAVNYLLYIRETYRQECMPMVLEIKDLLEVLGTRWESPSK